MEPRIFDRIAVDSFEPLENAERVECPKCSSLRKYFCYDCCVPLVNFPVIELPVKGLILKCKKEPRSKSSVVVVKVICQNSSEIIDCLGEDNSIPVFEPGSWLLFPGPEAKSFSELSDFELTNLKQFIFIDSTWHQTKSMLRNEKLAAVPKLKLENYVTAFWRYQNVSKNSLSTVEAVYYTYDDYHRELFNRRLTQNPAEGKYDNLLWMFKFNYDLIQKEYKDGSHKNKRFRRMPEYIKKD